MSEHDLKQCTRCKADKDRSAFMTASKLKDGLHPWCKDCWREWRLENLERRRAQSRKYCVANREKAKEASRKRYAENRDEAKAAQALWRKKNRGKAASNVASYRFKKRNAMPGWADREMIVWLYELAQRRSDETGVLHHVDHIIPLRGKRACGLHVPDNLRIIPASENLSKGVREVSECGVEWL